MTWKDGGSKLGVTGCRLGEERWRDKERSQWRRYTGTGDMGKRRSELGGPSPASRVDDGVVGGESGR